MNITGLRWRPGCASGRQGRRFAHPLPPPSLQRQKGWGLLAFQGPLVEEEAEAMLMVQKNAETDHRQMLKSGLLFGDKAGKAF